MKDMDLNFDEEKGIAYIKLSGSLSRKTILGAFDTAVFDKKYKNGMGRLWDFSDADLSSMKAGTIFEMAQYSKNFPPGINDVKVAFVTIRDLEYGLSRQFEMLSTGMTQIQVFRSIFEAEEWLME